MTQYIQTSLLDDQEVDHWVSVKVGPGKKIVLFGRDGLSLFAWRYGEDNSQYLGVFCTIFRNDGNKLSSLLIREADRIAWRIWPEMNRHITYVDPRKIKSVNPGYCFLRKLDGKSLV